MSHILTLNAGSSSIKFPQFATGDTLPRLVSGKVERIGSADARMQVTDLIAGKTERHQVVTPDHVSFVQKLANLWTLFAWKVRDVLDFGRDVNRLGHLNSSARTAHLLSRMSCGRLAGVN